MRMALVVAFLITPALVHADPQSDFWQALKASNYTNALEALTAWKKADPNSPDVIVGYINYHFSKSQTAGLSIDDYPKTGAGQSDSKLTFRDPKSGKNYYLNNKVFYDQAEIDRAMKYFNMGISKFPDRLDIRFGKIYVLDTLGRYAEAGKELVAALERSAQNKDAWLWTDNKPYGRSTNDFLSDIQDYYNIWLGSHTTAGLEAVKVAAEEQIRLYPKHSWAYDNLALYYSDIHDQQNAIKTLLESFRVDPADAITINNIANFYRIHHDNEKALHYYQMLLKSDNEQAKAQAKRMINLIKQSQQ